MITYAYWLLTAVVIIAALFVIGVRLGKWKAALVIAISVWLLATLAYYFWLQQIFVKRYGGRMTISVPAGMQHLGVTWKQDSLWVENYNPATDECVLQELSRGNLLEGKVIIRHCNPYPRRVVNKQQQP